MWLISHKKYLGSMHWRGVVVHGCIRSCWWCNTNNCKRVMTLHHFLFILFIQFPKKVFHGVWHSYHSLHNGHVYMFTNANRPLYSCLLSDLWMTARLQVTLFRYRPCCFCCVNEVVLMLTRCIYMRKPERSLSRQGHLQPRCHSKSRSPSREL